MSTAVPTQEIMDRREEPLVDPVFSSESSTKTPTKDPMSAADATAEAELALLSDRKARVLQSFVRGFLKDQHRMNEATRDEAVRRLQGVVRSLLLKTPTKKEAVVVETVTATGEENSHDADEKEVKSLLDDCLPWSASSMGAENPFHSATTSADNANIGAADDQEDNAADAPCYVENPFEIFFGNPTEGEDLPGPSARVDVDESIVEDPLGSGDSNNIGSNLTETENFMMKGVELNFDDSFGDQQTTNSNFEVDETALQQGWTEQPLAVEEKSGAEEKSAAASKIQKFWISQRVAVQAEKQTTAATAIQRGWIQNRNRQQQEQKTAAALLLRSHMRRKLVQQRVKVPSPIETEPANCVDEDEDDEEQDPSPMAIEPMTSSFETQEDEKQSIKMMMIDTAVTSNVAVPSDESVTSWTMEGSTVVAAAVADMTPKKPSSSTASSTTISIGSLLICSTTVAVLAIALLLGQRAYPSLCSPLPVGPITPENTSSSSQWYCPQHRQLVTTVNHTGSRRRPQIQLTVESKEASSSTPLLDVKGDALEYRPSEGVIVTRGRKQTIVAVPW